MKVLIIEDELPQAMQLQHFIVELENEFEITGITASVNDAIKTLQAHQIDLLFLDIHLADGLCFEIFEKVEIKCPVIFTTAYDNYAIQAFKHNGIEYLLKPIVKEELRKSIEKFKLFTQSNFDYRLVMQSIKAINERTKSFKKRFVSQAGKKLRIITTEEIAYFYAFKGGVYIKTFKNENHLIDATLENIEQEVDPFIFFRLNRKLIANISAIKEIFPYSKSRLKIELSPVFEGDVIVSYQNLENFMKWIRK